MLVLNFHVQSLSVMCCQLAERWFIEKEGTEAESQEVPMGMRFYRYGRMPVGV